MKKRRCSLRFATNEPPALRTPGKETPPMKEKSTETGTESRPAWESLEALARQGVQRLLQQLLEEEVEEVLGRRRYERRDGVEAPPGYRNGWGKPRRLSAMAGTITVRRPRVRGLEARFESRLLPLFKRRTEAVGRLLPELYLHGLAQGDFDLALRGLLGAAAPLSAPSIARLKASWQVEYESWKRRRLDNLEPVYFWADGIYIKAGLEKAKAAMLVLIAALRDGRKVVLAVESAAAHCRRAPGDLGRGGRRVPGGQRAAVLEPSPRERARHAAEAASGGGAGAAHEDPLRGDAGGGGAPEADVPGVGHEEGRRRRGPPARRGLGATGDFLRVPEGALEASQDHERRGVAVRDGAAADRGSEAVQEGGERNGGHLEDATRRGAALSPAGRARAPPRGRRGRGVRRRRAEEAEQREGCRLRACPLDHLQDNR